MLPKTIKWGMMLFTACALIIILSPNTLGAYTDSPPTTASLLDSYPKHPIYTTLVFAIPCLGILLFFFIWSMLLRQQVHERTQELNRTNKMLRAIIDDIPQRVFWKDAEFRYVDGNKAYYQDIGAKSADDFRGKTDFDMFPEKSALQFRADDVRTMADDQGIVITNDHQPLPDGRTLWLRTSKSVLHDENGKAIGILGTYEDITEKKQADEKLHQLLAELEQKNAILEKLAITDHLTGLYNRRFMADQLIEAAAEYARQGVPFCLGVYDLDGLKKVNDSCGHHVGDALLVEAARGIQASVRAEDYVARHGGDEFVVLFNGLPLLQSKEISEAIRLNVLAIKLPDCEVPFGISGGLAEYNGGSIGKLMQQADRKLYKAKQNGRNIIES